MRINDTRKGGKREREGCVTSSWAITHRSLCGKDGTNARFVLLLFRKYFVAPPRDGIRHCLRNSLTLY